MSKSRTELMGLYHMKRCQALYTTTSYTAWGLALRALLAMQCSALRLCERLQATEEYIIAA